MLLHHLTWLEFERELKKTKTVIVPIGPVEQHGPHLPLGTDFIRPFELALKVAKKVRVFVHPTLPLGGVYKGKNFPGTISIKGKLLTELIVDLGENFVRHGFKKIIILSGHSSSKHTPFIQAGLKRIKQNYKKIKTYYLVDAYCCDNVRDKVIETKCDKHAGEAETSMMMFLRKDLVRTNKRTREFPEEKEILKNLDNPRKVWKTGLVGDATKATKTKGDKLITEQIRYLVKIIKE